MMTDDEIREAISAGLMEIDPLSVDCVEPASYDFRVGTEAFVSGGDAKIKVDEKGLVIIDPANSR